MAAHRYWRVYCRMNSGDTNYTGLTEVEMATSAAGADVTSTTFAIGSGTYQAGTASDAFDDDFTGDVVQWTGTGAGKWVGQDFGAANEKDIIEVRIRPNKDAANRTFAEFDIQFSDDNVTWTTLWSASYTAWVIGTTVTFSLPSAVASRHWRLRADTLVSGNTMSCAELEMRLTHGGADQCSGGTASARTTYSGYPASQAFDNNSATLWSGNAGVDDCEWLAYDFGSGVTKDIQQLYFTSRNDASYTQSPTAGWIESSPDGVSWLKRKTFSGLSWSQGSSNTIDVVAPAGGRRRHAALLV